MKKLMVETEVQTIQDLMDDSVLWKYFSKKKLATTPASGELKRLKLT